MKAIADKRLSKQTSRYLINYTDKIKTDYWVAVVFFITVTSYISKIQFLKSVYYLLLKTITTSLYCYQMLVRVCGGIIKSLSSAVE